MRVRPYVDQEPDLATEIGRAADALKEEAADEIPTPAQQRQSLRAHVNLGHPPKMRILRRPEKRALPLWCGAPGENVTFVVLDVKHDRCHVARLATALPKCYPFNQVCGIDTMNVRNPLDTAIPVNISHVICFGTRCHQWEQRRDMSSEETFATLPTFVAQALRCNEIADHGPDRICEGIPECLHRGIIPLVCDLETQWQNAVT